jgi:serine/threonine protein kinase
MVLTQGTRVGAYEIQALIGSGGMGSVYRARDTRVGSRARRARPPAVVAHLEPRVPSPESVDFPGISVHTLGLR